uniref:ANK_REP_REGION domain-containing protein n=1 Tax=Macrostomum lignano TaxID=282301 RepID=A0A1I8JPW8_9PLAT
MIDALDNRIAHPPEVIAQLMFRRSELGQVATGHGSLHVSPGDRQGPRVLNRGAAPPTLNATNAEGYTAMHLAAAWRNAEALKDHLRARAATSSAAAGSASVPIEVAQRYGNFRWAEAANAFAAAIRQMRETLADTGEAAGPAEQGREKGRRDLACTERRANFIAMRLELEDQFAPIYIKLSEPLPERQILVLNFSGSRAATDRCEQCRVPQARLEAAGSFLVKHFVHGEDWGERVLGLEEAVMSQAVQQVVRGYAVCHLPIAAGPLRQRIPLFAPKSSVAVQLNPGLPAEATSRHYTDPKILGQGQGRQVTRVRSLGHVNLTFNTCLKKSERLWLPDNQRRRSELLSPRQASCEGWLAAHHSERVLLEPSQSSMGCANRRPGRPRIQQTDNTEPTDRASASRADGPAKKAMNGRHAVHHPAGPGNAGAIEASDAVKSDAKIVNGYIRLRRANSRRELVPPCRRLWVDPIVQECFARAKVVPAQRLWLATTWTLAGPAGGHRATCPPEQDVLRSRAAERSERKKLDALFEGVTAILFPCCRCPTMTTT